jgi:hypothetical protein
MRTITVTHAEPCFKDNKAAYVNVQAITWFADYEIAFNGSYLNVKETAFQIQYMLHAEKECNQVFGEAGE